MKKFTTYVVCGAISIAVLGYWFISYTNTSAISKFDDPGDTNWASHADPVPVDPHLVKTAFGELTVAESTPRIQLQFPYNINAAQVISFPGNGGTVTGVDDHANVMTGTAADGFAFILSRDVINYNPGQGVLARFSAIFTPGVADSEQVIGIGANLDGLFFGYDGVDFGVLRRKGGAPELRTLQITTPSTTAENITITLDGDVDATVAVTNSGDVDVTAREIAAHIYASLGTGWGALSAGDTITFVSVDAASHLGSYAISGATVAGTYGQIAAGAAATDSWTDQADWNVDGMDSSINVLNPSGITLDQTKGNVYQIRFKYLGYGANTFFIENPETGLNQLVHRIEYANVNTSPSLSNPTLGLFMHVLNKGNTTSLTLKTASMAGLTEGREQSLGPHFSAENLFVIGAVTTEEPVLTIRNKQVYQSQINRVRIQPTIITLTSSLVTGDTTFRIYIQATAENGASYSDINTNASAVEFDTSAVDFNINDVAQQFSFTLSAQDSRLFLVSDLINKIPPGTTMMITAQPSKSNAINEVGAAVNWIEEF